MKAVVYYDENTMKCEAVPRPTIRDGEILLKMRVCGICGGDLLHWYRKKKAPIVLGHEITGEVVETGAGVERPKPGDRVFVHHHIACGTCYYCAHGDYIQCAGFSASSIAPGGLAEYIRVSAPIVRGDVLPLPPNLSFEIGSLTEPLACCLKSVCRADLRVGDALGIIGAGPAGIMTIELARKTRGARAVVVSEKLESRRKMAGEFGALVVDPARQSFAEAAREATGGIGVDAVIVTVAGSRAILEALEAVRRGGVVVVYAPPSPGDSLTVDPTTLFFAEKHIHWSYTSSHVETRQALDLLASGAVDLRRMISRTYPLEEAPQAFRKVEAREHMKVLITSG